MRKTSCKKLTITPAESQILKIFLGGWQTLKDASKKYNPNLRENAPNSRSVAFYFKKFKEHQWLEEEKKEIMVERRSKLGKEEKYSCRCDVFRANYIFYFERTKLVINDVLKELIICFLEEDLTREILKNTDGHIIDIIDRQLFFLCGALIQMRRCLESRNLIPKGALAELFNLQDIKKDSVTPTNFKEIIELKKEIIKKQPKEMQFLSLLSLYGFVGAELGKRKNLKLEEEFKNLNPLLLEYYELHNFLYSQHIPNNNPRGI